MYQNQEDAGGNDVFSTRDIALAATLIVLGFPMFGVDFQIEGPEGKTVGYFLFEKNQKLIEAERLYIVGDLLIEPKNFSSTIRSLKSKLVNVYKNPRNNIR